MCSDPIRRNGAACLRPFPRPTYLGAIAWLGLWMGFLPTGHGAGPLPLRSGVEIFADDVNIQRMEHVVRRIHPARKLPGVVLAADRPWEGAGTYQMGTTRRDPVTGEFRKWYCAESRLLYATSKDGIHWDKPELDIETYEGRKTNIVMKEQHIVFTVLFDEQEPDPAKRYKALGAEHAAVSGYRAYYSADGLHWRPQGDGRTIPFGSELIHLIRDPATGKYFAYIRPLRPERHPRYITGRRLCAVTTSDDFVNWSEMRIVVVPDEIDDAWVKEPHQRTEFYEMNGFAYGRSYLGILPVFRITTINVNPPPRQSVWDGPMHGELITSRDGLKWDRMKDRTPLIPSGTTFDVSVMHVSSEPLIVGDEVWQYYTALSAGHGGPPDKAKGIALARWRLDGFVSLDAGAQEGVVETKPITDRTGVLEINADAAHGRVAVEVLDESGRVIDGYAAADCVALESDQIRFPVRWKQREQLPVGGPYRLRFILKDSSLFSYTMVPAVGR